MIGTGMALLGASAIGGLGSYFAGKQAKRAGEIQAEAGQRGLDNALMIYNQGRADLAPYRDTGAGAVTTLAQLYGIATPGNPNPEAFNSASVAAFERSPDYKFAFDQGNKAVQFSAAAKGALGSGNTLRDLTSFGQGLATQNFQNYAQRLLALAQMGQSAAATGVSQGAQFGQFAADQYGNIGQARAAGLVGQANAWNQGVSDVGNNLMLYNLMKAGNPSAYGGSMSGYDPSWGTQVAYA